MKEKMISSEKIKAEALRLGFSSCGIAKAEAVDEETARHFREWISQGKQAEMHYMENHLEKRLDPRLLMEGLKTIVCVALNYTPAKQLPTDEYQIAAYALGQDYHDIVRQRLHQLAAVVLHSLQTQDTYRIPQHTNETVHTDAPLPSHVNETTHTTETPYRAFSDSAPILERYWAVKAGMGWIGKNHQLIIPPSTNTQHPSADTHQPLSPSPIGMRQRGTSLQPAGSMFFLGELFLDIEADYYDEPMKNRCGNCQLCIEACPTHALADDTHSFDAHRCLSYQTIENRGDIPAEMAAKMGNTIYGCDRCQQACPWNHFAMPTTESMLHPSEELLAMTRTQWQNLTQEDYRRLFKGSAVKRAKYEGLMRNIHAVEKLQPPLNPTEETQS